MTKLGRVTQQRSPAQQQIYSWVAGKKSIKLFLHSYDYFSWTFIVKRSTEWKCEDGFLFSQDDNVLIKVNFGLTTLTVCFVVDEQLQWAIKSPDLTLNVMMWLDLKIQLCWANA